MVAERKIHTHRRKSGANESGMTIGKKLQSSGRTVNCLTARR
jgi:hypothetical protein